MTLNHTLPSSALARYFALCYSAIIVIVSLYPFTSWRTTGIPLLDFYSYPLPYYQTVFDNTVNVIAYVPLGFAAALAVSKRWIGMIVALCWGVLLSASIEFTQQFLPTRIASNLDILSNITGTLTGALLAILIPWHTLPYYLRIRHNWLQSGQWIDVGIVWLGLWFFTQLDPVVPLFSLVNPITDLPQPIHSPLRSPTIFLILLGTSSISLHIISVALFASCLVKCEKTAIPLIWLIFAIGFLGKIVSALSMLDMVRFFTWLNFNVLLGSFIAILALTVALKKALPTRQLLGAISLLLGIIIHLNWPITPSFSAILRLLDWQYGHLLHFVTLVDTLRQIWPYGALLILLGLIRQGR